MIYDFIEIGTSDFDTLIESTENQIGLSIEPIKYYLDNLPKNSTVIKINCAITEYDGEVKIYYINPIDIKHYQLPNWLKGCNSILNPHPSAMIELQNRNLEFLMRSYYCECLTWETLIKRYDIDEVNLLKIDTEGHDCNIINSILDNKTILPKKIHFEANILTDPKIIEKTVQKLLDFNYKIKQKTDHEIIVEL